MRRLGYLAAGLLLLLLGLAKVAGLWHALATSGSPPLPFVAKQAVYAIGLVGGGLALVLSGWKARDGQAAGSRSAGET